MATGGTRGFSLVELMIVLAILGTLVGIAAPSLLSARSAADETAAVATLRQIVLAQVQLQQSARIDVDDDGAGEYGGLLELSGAAAGRMPRPLDPKVLSGAFRALNAGGEAHRGGYLFRLHLPDASGAGIGEPRAGFTRDGSIAADRAESAWVVYAWPMNAHGAETRAYVANQTGFLLAAYDGRYAGPGNGPAADAAYVVAGSIMGALALDAPAADGNVWTPVR